METKVYFRLPPALREAAESKAAQAGKSLGIWIRSLVERATGVTVEVVPGRTHETTEERAERMRESWKRRAKRK